MMTLLKILLVPALGISAMIFFFFLIGGGTTGRSSDQYKGFIIGGIGLAACLYSGYRAYLAGGITGWDWLALVIALSPIALITVPGADRAFENLFKVKTK